MRKFRFLARTDKRTSAFYHWLHWLNQNQQGLFSDVLYSFFFCCKMSWRRCNTNRNPNLWKSSKNHHPVKMFLHEPLTSWIFLLQLTEVSSACKLHLPARSPLILSCTAYLFWIQECSSKSWKTQRQSKKWKLGKVSEFSGEKNTYLPAKIANLCSVLCQWKQSLLPAFFKIKLFLIINNDKQTNQNKTQGSTGTDNVLSALRNHGWTSQWDSSRIRILIFDLFGGAEHISILTLKNISLDSPLNSAPSSSLQWTDFQGDALRPTFKASFRPWDNSDTCPECWQTACHSFIYSFWSKSTIYFPSMESLL